VAGRRNRKAELAAWLDESRPAAITEAEFAELLSRLSPVSESYLRRLLRGADVPLAPLVEGVRQNSFDDLRRTLLALEREYAAADAGRARACRRIVIQAKDHARWSLRGGKLPPASQTDKQEMILWMLTWLENPAAFPLWLEMRIRRISPVPAAPSPE
jgi:hypothetical protein